MFSVGAHTRWMTVEFHGQVVTSDIRLSSRVTDVLRLKVFADVQESKDHVSMWALWTEVIPEKV